MANYKGGYQILELGSLVLTEETEITDPKILNKLKDIIESSNNFKPVLLVYTDFEGSRKWGFVQVSDQTNGIVINEYNFYTNLLLSASIEDSVITATYSYTEN